MCIWFVQRKKQKRSFLANLVSLRKYFKQFENYEQNVQKDKLIQAKTLFENVPISVKFSKLWNI